MQPSSVLYLHRRDDFDETLPMVDSFEEVTLLRLLIRIWREYPFILEVPEPMWFKYLPISLAASIVARARGRLGRRKITLVTYAIENSTLDRLPRPLSERKFPPWLWKGAARIFTRAAVRLVDRLAFGTSGARHALRDAVGSDWFDTRVEARAAVFEALPAACACDAFPRQAGLVLFLGALEPRKGFDLVAEAWPEVRRELGDRVSLIVAGEGSLQARADALAADTRLGVSTLHGVGRAQVHELLRRASLLVLPSQPMHRWREQVGLPLTEALAHGVKVVATTETGLSDWLEGSGAEVLKVPSTSADLSSAIVRKVRSDGPISYDLPRVDGRLAADSWMTLGARR